MGTRWRRTARSAALVGAAALAACAGSATQRVAPAETMSASHPTVLAPGSSGLAGAPVTGPSATEPGPSAASAAPTPSLATAPAAPDPAPPVTGPPDGAAAESGSDPAAAAAPAEAGDGTDATGSVGADDPATGTGGGAASAPGSGFVFEAGPIGDDVRARMVPTSWRPGCPVALEDLRYLRIAHRGFDGQVHLGELVVAAGAVDDIRAVFARLFAAGFPIRQMRLVDDYGGDDSTSIEADNTSAFNCRPVTGSSSGWSEHAYGRAIDVNPIENPYVYADGTTDHPGSQPFLDRGADRPGMAVEHGVLVAAFDERGWGWGGRWSAPVDYQHFSASGR